LIFAGGTSPSSCLDLAELKKKKKRRGKREIRPGAVPDKKKERQRKKFTKGRVERSRTKGGKVKEKRKALIPLSGRAGANGFLVSKESGMWTRALIKDPFSSKRATSSKSGDPGGGDLKRKIPCHQNLERFENSSNWREKGSGRKLRTEGPPPGYPRRGRRSIE